MAKHQLPYVAHWSVQQAGAAHWLRTEPPSLSTTRAYVFVHAPLASRVTAELELFAAGTDTSADARAVDRQVSMPLGSRAAVGHTQRQMSMGAPRSSSVLPSSVSESGASRLGAMPEAHQQHWKTTKPVRFRKSGGELFVAEVPLGPDGSWSNPTPIPNDVRAELRFKTVADDGGATPETIISVQMDSVASRFLFANLQPTAPDSWQRFYEQLALHTFQTAGSVYEALWRHGVILYCLDNLGGSAVLATCLRTETGLPPSDTNRLKLALLGQVTMEWPNTDPGDPAPWWRHVPHARGAARSLGQWCRGRGGDGTRWWTSGGEHVLRMMVQGTLLLVRLDHALPVPSYRFVQAQPLLFELGAPSAAAKAELVPVRALTVGLGRLLERVMAQCHKKLDDWPVPQHSKATGDALFRARLVEAVLHVYRRSQSDLRGGIEDTAAFVAGIRSSLSADTGIKPSATLAKAAQANDRDMAELLVASERAEVQFLALERDLQACAEERRSLLRGQLGELARTFGYGCMNQPEQAVAGVAGRGFSGFSRLSFLCGVGRGYRDGSLDNARLDGPNGMVQQPKGGDLLFVEGNNHTLRALSPDGNVRTIMGRHGMAGHRDGDNGLLNEPKGLYLAPNGCLYIADSANHCIRVMNSKLSRISTYVGTRAAGARDGDHNTAQFRFPSSVVFLKTGEMVVADTLNHALRLVAVDAKPRRGGDPVNLKVTTLAGVMGKSGSKDGPKALLNSPTDMVVLSDNSIIFTESTSHCVRQLRLVNKKARVTTIVGERGLSGRRTGLGDLTRMRQPAGLSLLSDTEFLVCDVGNNRILHVHFGEAPVEEDEEGTELALMAGHDAGQAAGAAEAAAAVSSVSSTPSTASTDGPAAQPGSGAAAADGPVPIANPTARAAPPKGKSRAPAAPGRVWQAEEVAFYEDVDGLADAPVAPRWLVRQPDGCFLVAETSTHQIRRLALPPRILEARNAYRKTYGRVGAELARLLGNADRLRQLLATLVLSLQALKPRVQETTRLAQATSHRARVDHLLAQPNALPAHPSLLSATVAASPFPAELPALADKGLPTSLDDLFAANVVQYLEAYAWSGQSDYALQLQGLKRLADTHPQLLGLDGLAALFANPSFAAPAAKDAFALLASVLQRYEFCREDQIVGSCKAAVCAWLARLLDAQDAAPAAGLEDAAAGGHPVNATDAAARATAFLPRVLRVSEVLSSLDNTDAASPTGRAITWSVFALLGELCERASSGFLADVCSAVAQPELSRALIPMLLELAQKAVREFGLQSAALSTLAGARAAAEGPGATDSARYREMERRLILTMLDHLAAPSAADPSWFVHNDLLFWCRFTGWCDRRLDHAARADDSAPVPMFPDDADVSERLAADNARVSSALRRLPFMITQGTVRCESVEPLVACREDLSVAWAMLCGTPDAVPGAPPEEEVTPGAALVLELQADVAAARTALVKLTTVCGTFFEDSQLAELAAVLEDEWQVLRVSDVLRLLLLTSRLCTAPLPPSPALPDGFAESSQRLPRLLLLALDWLNLLSGSAVFRSVWAEIPAGDLDGDTAMTRLEGALSRWAVLFISLSDLSIPIPALDGLCPALANEHELRSLYATGAPLPTLAASAPTPEGGDSPRPSPRLAVVAPIVLSSLDQAWLNRASDRIALFQKLFKIKHAAADMERCLQILPALMADDALAELIALGTHVAAVGASMGGAREALTLGDCLGVEGAVRAIDVRLASLSPRLVQGVIDSGELLAFLQTLSDQDFGAALQMALAKTEMDTPVELWVPAEGDDPGHVNEAVLSTLTSIRTWLHCYIHRPIDKPTRAVDVLDALDVDWFDLEQLAKLERCAHLRVAIVEILEDTNDSAAPVQLLRLCEAESESLWVLASPRSDTRCSLHLQHTKLRGGGHKVHVTRSVDDLLDFQCTVLLARASQGSPATQHAIDTFVEQFSWVRHLAALVEGLKARGHLGFVAYAATIPFDCPPPDLQARARGLQEALASWERTLVAVRAAHPITMNFTAQQLVAQAEHLDGAPGSSEAALDGLLCCLNPDLRTADRVAGVGARLQAAWNTRSRPGMDAEERLVAVAEVLTAELGPLPHPRVRALAGNADLGALRLKHLQVALFKEDDQVYEAVLSLFALSGRLPERHNLCLCTADSTMEAVFLFLQRWAASPDPAALFCLAPAEHLRFEIQSAVVPEVQRLAIQARARLVIVFGEGHGRAHLATQLSFARMQLDLLPPERIAACLDELCSSYSGGIACITSARAGAGKSYAARAQAHELGLPYVYVPVCASSDLVPSFLLSGALQQQQQQQQESEGEEGRDGGRPGGALLHIDLADTVDQRFNQLMFEFAVLGGIMLPSGDFFFWDPRSSLVFEVASGPLADRLRVHAKFSPRACSSHKELFDGDEAHLRAGMGPAFCSPLDGGVNAFVRLQTCCQALDTLRQRSGSFPLDWTPGAAMEGPPVPGAFCYDLVFAAVKKAECSFRSSWNFINVLFLQLREMHADSSPFSAIFRDDGESEGQTAKLESIKGAIVQMLVSTAAEFASNAQHSSGGRKLKGVEVEGFDNASLNGSYRRDAEDVCGRPAFTWHFGKYTSAQTLRFDGQKQAWVIRDSQWVVAQSLSPDWSRPWRMFKKGTNGMVLGTARDQRFVVEYEEAEEAPTQPAAGGGAGAVVCPSQLVVPWSQSNHEVAVFSNVTRAVYLLALDASLLHMHLPPKIKEFCAAHDIWIGTNMESSQPFDVLSSLTGVQRSVEEGQALLGGSYCLTNDNLLKMLAIIMRLRAGLPVILSGECGCGKTMLIQYLSAWMRYQFLHLDLHGGTRAEEIADIVAEAEALIEAENVEVCVFLDEINACLHLGLLNELVSHRTLRGRPISPRLRLVAAMNPYRLRKATGKSSGLVFKMHLDTYPFRDDLSNLVYRVHPVPHSFSDLVYDFGALSGETERQYIDSMVDTHLHACSAPDERRLITELIVRAQDFVRESEEDASAASLRDVRRALRLTLWFLDKLVPRKKDTRISPLACAVTLALAFAYYYRLPTAQARSGFWEALRTVVGAGLAAPAGFARLAKKGSFSAVIKGITKRLCDQVDVGDGIALNNALSENLFVVVISILNRLPVFVVGKPGSSKTLTLQVIASNLMGAQSPGEFWRQFPAVNIFPYQCSPLSSSHAIQSQFDMAMRYQQFAQNTITVLLLDEVGLAEHSPEMPLKVLHKLLVNPPISIVALSNWALDPAKMNRAICLNRPEPDAGDIELTGRRIFADISSFSEDIAAQMERILKPLSEAYYEIYHDPACKDFFGLRDWYELIKFIRRKLQAKEDHKLNSTVLTMALCRNFGGKPEILQHILDLFHRRCFRYRGLSKPLSMPQLLRANQEDSSDPRHLMVLTSSQAILPLLFSCNILEQQHTTVLIGSGFQMDMNELHLVQQINLVKVAMSAGETVVLLNHNNIYEALYDVLNQRYITRTDNKTGKTRRLLRLAIGARSQLCQVEDGFKIVVIVDRNEAQHLDLPLLNRFEKQVATARELLEPNQQALVAKVEAWVQAALAEAHLPSPSDLFAGFCEDTIPSAVLEITNFDDELAGTENEGLFPRVQEAMLEIATPVAVNQSPTLLSVLPGYFESHADLPSCLSALVARCDDGATATVLLTRSPSAHLDGGLLDRTATVVSEVETLRLSELSSEADLEAKLGDFFAVAGYGRATAAADQRSRLLLIQGDPVHTAQPIISHAMHICAKALARFRAHVGASVGAGQAVTAAVGRHVMFVIHLPSGIKKRHRQWQTAIYRPWATVFVDDIRAPAGDSPLTVVQLLRRSVSDLLGDGLLSLRDTLLRRYQSALTMCKAPRPAASGGGEDEERFSSLARMKHLLGQLQQEPFLVVFEGLVADVLSKYRKVDEHGMHYHVRLAVTDLGHGTFVESLRLACEILITQSFAQALRWLDTNFNLACTHTPEMTRLWLELANNPNIVDRDWIASSALIGGSGVAIDQVVRNFGQHGPMVARFPFSWRLVLLLNSSETRELVADKKAKGANLLLHFFNSCFRDLTEALAPLLHDHCRLYVHDYLRIVGPNFASVPFEEHYAVAMAFVRAAGVATIPEVHSTMWQSEQPIFDILSLFSAAWHGPQAELLSLIDDDASEGDNEYLLAEAGREGGADSESSASQRLVHRLLSAYLGQALHEAEQAPPGEWLGVAYYVQTIAPFVQSLLLGLPRSSGLHRSWVCLRLLSFAMRAAVDLEIDPTAAQALLPGYVAVVRESNIFSRAGFLTVCGQLAAAVPDGGARLAAEVAAQVLDGILEPDARLGERLEDDLVEELGRVAGRASAIGAAHPRLQRVAVLKLVQMDKIAKLVPRLATPAVVLLVQLLEATTASAATETEFVGKDLALLQTTSLSMRNARAFVRARIALRRFLDKMAEMPENVGTGLDVAEMEVLRDHIGAQGMAINWLSATAGAEGIFKVLVNTRRAVEWSGVNFSLLRKPAAAIDAFPLAAGELTAQYLTLCQSLKALFGGGRSRAAVNSGVQELQSRERPDLVIGAFASSIADAGDSRVAQAWLKERFRTAAQDPSREVQVLLFAGRHTSLDARIHRIVADACGLAVCVGGWMASVLFEPDSIKYHFLPSFEGNELDMAMGALPGVGWYKCPNGHVYAIGECTRPMQAAFCPTCGTSIGGRNHQFASGNTPVRRRAHGPARIEPGYSKSLTTVAGYNQGDTSPLVIIALRLILHSLLYAARHLGEGRGLRRVLGVQRADEYLCERMDQDLRALASRASLSLDRAQLAMHLVMARMRSFEPVRHGPFLLSDTLVTYHKEFAAHCVHPVFDHTLARRLFETHSMLETCHKMASVSSALAGFWGKHNRQLNTNDRLLLWHCKNVVSIDEFSSSFEIYRVYLPQCPLTEMVLKHQRTLPFIRFAADILAWHAIVFEAFPCNTLTRDEASRLTNEDVVNKVSENRRPEAEAALERFCTAFNQAFPLLTPNLYECSPNLFVTPAGEVDLSAGNGGEAGPVAMSRAAPLAFSLPCVIRFGAVDAPTLCTVELLSLLERAQNQITDAINGGGGAEPPPLTMHSQRATALQQLIVFDLRREFLPLLFACTHEGGEEGADDVRNQYDFLAVEAQLRLALGTKQHLVIKARHYQYAGELQARGRLRALHARVPQEPLPAECIEIVCQELDLQRRMALLMTQLEECVEFLVGMGAGTLEVDGAVPLQEFVVSTLLLDPERWASMSSTAINEQVQLKHLQSLFLALEEYSQGGSALDDVHPAYREELPADLAEGLRAAVQVCDLGLLRPLLRDLLTTHLLTANFSPVEELKPYLVYLTEVDLEDLDWFGQIPDELLLCHALSVHALLAEYA